MGQPSRGRSTAGRNISYRVVTPPLRVVTPPYRTASKSPGPSWRGERRPSYSDEPAHFGNERSCDFGNAQNSMFQTAKFGCGNNDQPAPSQPPGTPPMGNDAFRKDIPRRNRTSLAVMAAAG